ncbi:hypothetical protein, partial [Ornithinibacillus scapharcae]|uniref:hypothetical protein n=1 Tax=Ornithinibacillus scapharcae TaxID=1147159 RepID=UPI000225B3ED
MERISKEQILKMGKKHKKWNEDVIVEIFPYLVNNNRYYLAYYMKKFTMDVKKIALVSPDSPSKDEALTALKPLINFTVVFGNIENFSKTRAELKFDVINEIRDYLEVILSSGLLSGNLMIYYERSFQIITEIIKLQDEMIKIRKKVNSMAQRILGRGYFMDEEIDESLELFSEIGWIQY